MAAHLFELSEDDSFLEVAKYIGDLLDGGQEKESEEAETAGSRFAEESRDLYANQRMTTLLDKYIAQLDVVFAAAGEDTGDLEAVLDILCHLVQRTALSSPQQLALSAELLAGALCAATSPFPELRLQTLFTLYNVVGSPSVQYAVLLRALGYGAATGAAAVLLPLVAATSGSWATDLGLSGAQERAALAAAAQALAAGPPAAAAQAHALRLRVLASYEGPGAGDAAEARPVAARVVTDFLRSPDAFTFDLLASPGVAALAKHPSTSPLHQLLHAFLLGGVRDFRAVLAQYPDLLPFLAWDQEAAMDKMRLAALAGLAHAHPVLTFDQLQDALDVPAAAVEPLVVRAIGKKLLEARIDQLARTVSVSRSAPRSFGAGDWVALQTTLRTWQVALDRAEQVAEDKKALLQQGLTTIKA